MSKPYGRLKHDLQKVWWMVIVRSPLPACRLAPNRCLDPVGAGDVARGSRRTHEGMRRASRKSQSLAL
jgi:hypothetical protein